MPDTTPTLSPCVGICELDAAGLCVGCWRTIDEIGQWVAMGQEERLRIMEEVLPGREAQLQDPSVKPDLVG